MLSASFWLLPSISDISALVLSEAARTSGRFPSVPARSMSSPHYRPYPFRLILRGRQGEVVLSMAHFFGSNLRDSGKRNPHPRGDPTFYRLHHGIILLDK